MRSTYALSTAAALIASVLLGGCVAQGGKEEDAQKGAELAAETIAGVALANVGHKACGTNTSGGVGYESSCTGNGGRPEYWCADFAKWVWASAGVTDLGGLTAGAGSFYVYGQAHQSLSGTPHVGDAVVFDYQGGAYADHVAIVTQVNADGTIETVSGDWGGNSPDESTFSSQSTVVLNGPAYPGKVGTWPPVIGMTISGFISPAGVTYAPPAPTPPPAPYYRGMARDATSGGYWIIGDDGGVFSYGDAGFKGSMGGKHLSQPVVGMIGTPSGNGYWLVASDGGVFGFGDAGFHGSTGNIKLNAPVVGMAATPSGQGYWLVASDGGIFAFGDAGFHGSTGNTKLNAPVVGMAATASGQGYWLVASDGGIFSFGDAGFYGSTGNIKLNAPVVGMAATPSGHGYWLVASDGGIFSFGDAGFHGSTGDIKLNAPVVGMAASKSGEGYWLVGGDGGIFSFGDAAFHGSRG